MSDPTEDFRREMVQAINAEPGSREALEKEYGNVWDTDEMVENFQVVGFAAPFVIVRKKDTGEKGSLMFQHSPRFYFSWSPA